ncbi:Putative methyltransferase NSUN6 [Myotis davidii]|uniref:Putative methyltransferase NSUN6 n=1 Tax=Myotis davidii TaxID=225400 RepID=L5M499_MYODS|nr:Putative methyltransferase NSUN6 [Myotis davidii]
MSAHVKKIQFKKNIAKQQCEAIVGAQCGNAVLRGAHVYVPGIVSASKFMKAGDVVSVYSDIKGKCKKGAKEFDGTKVFLGNGISELSRRGIFNGLPERKGIGIRMTEPVYRSPSFDNVLPSYLFLQDTRGNGEFPDIIIYILEARCMKVHALERVSLSPACPLSQSWSPRVGGDSMIRGRRCPHHTSAAATASSASLSPPWLPEPQAALGSWAAEIQDLSVPWASAEQLTSEACLCLGPALGSWGAEGGSSRTVRLLHLPPLAGLKDCGTLAGLGGLGTASL